MIDSQVTADRSMTLATLAKLVNAEVIFPEEQSGQDKLLAQSVAGIATLANATAQDVSFVSHPKYKQQLKQSQAMAVLVNAEMAPDCPVVALVVSDPYAAFACLSQQFEYHTESVKSGVSLSAHIHDTVKLPNNVIVGHGVTIGQHVVIGEGTVISSNTVIEDHVTIGKDCHIGPSVVIHHHCQLGDRVRVHAQASIGAEGFGFAPVKPESTDQAFRWERIAQLGRVIIGNDVRIGASTCIDRGALDDTVIGNGVIIDNLVQVAHNVRIGDFTAIAACTGIAGSTQIGKHCMIGGQVGISGHLSIADGVTISGGSVVLSSIKQSGQVSSGIPSMPTPQWRRAAINFKQLAEQSPKKLAAEISDLKEMLNALESRLN